MLLNHARILLTGASGGLGEALAGQLSAAGAALLLTGRNADKLAAIRLAAGAECVRLPADLATAEGIADALAEGRYGMVGFEPSAMSVALFRALRRKAKNVRWKPLASELADLRAVKDPAEIGQIRKAIRIATGAMQSTLGSIRPGACELDIAVELEYKMRKKGAEGLAFFGQDVGLVL